MKVKAGMITKIRTVAVLLLCLSLLLSCVACSGVHESAQSQKVIGIAWCADDDYEPYTNVVKSIKAAGGSSILLPQILSANLSYDKTGTLTDGVAETGALTDEAGKMVRCSGYQESSIADAVAKVSAVVFAGGEDISPSLYYKPEPWHGIETERDYNAERDVSDYLLMEYCLDHNIPVIGFCRGMQMLCVVSGAEFIQDIPTYFSQMGLEYQYQHCNPKGTPDSYCDYASHDVSVLVDSLLYKITGTALLSGCPSWHHQAVRNVDNTCLRVVGTLNTDGIEMIEAVERTDKTFALGLQFHPEAAVAKRLENAKNADNYMKYDDAVCFFKYLLELP